MKIIASVAAVILLSVPSFGAAAAGPARIGAAAAVKGAVRATAPGSVGRVIGSGKPLYLNDHVTTDAAGKLQVLLLDETVFTLGPNADMVLDQFVYDPETGAGKVAAQITKGAFRFVTGKVARNKPENMNVKLKVGTIGVRGTVVVGETGDAGSTIINAGASPDNEAGEQGSNVLAENNGETTLITQPGEGVRLLPNQTPGGPSDMTGELDRISNALSVEPPKNQQASGGGAGGSAEDESGQSTGSGAGNAVAGAAAADASDNSGDLVTNVLQQGYGASKWSDLAQLRGSAVYTGGGNYVCVGGSGPSCGAGTPGTFTFNLGVNFDAQTIGGAGSTLSMSGPIAGTGTINQLNYAGKFGDATTTISGSIAAGNFNNTEITFQNANGEVASELTMELKYTDASSHQVSGTGTGTR